jgi:hypothetical protein
MGFRMRDSNSITVFNAPAYRMSFYAGDSVSFLETDLSRAGFTTTVISARNSGDNWDLDLRDDVPLGIRSLSGATLATYVVVNNRWKARDIVVRNIWAHDNRARGILLQASNFVVADSVFEHVQQPGIKVTWDVQHYGEGTGTENVYIVNNVFDSVDKNDFRGEGAFKVEMLNSLGTVSNPKPIRGHVNLEVEGNLFRNVPKRVMDISGTVNTTVSRNRIEMTMPDVPTQLFRGNLKFDDNVGLRVDRNVFVQSAYNPPPEPLTMPLSTNNVFLDPELDAGGVNNVYQQNTNADGPLRFVQGGKEIRPSSSQGGLQPPEPAPSYIPGQLRLKQQLAEMQAQQ